jgi:phosphotriesterase-related protein
VAGHWLLLLDDLLSRRFGQKNLIAGRFRVAILSTIPTVRGPVELDRLGPTLMHEHVFVLDPEAVENYGHLWGASFWDEEARVADAIAKLRRLRDGGVETIVDPTVFGLGRYIPRIRRVNAEVDLNIVVATGVYAFLELPNFLAYRSDDWIVELFVREIREGIDDTGVKAAFLKCAVERHGIIGDVPRILAAIAAAAVETGVPVMVHTNAIERTGLPALETLTNAGVDPRRIVIAHAGDSNDLGYLRAIADTGASLGCDRFNIEHFNPDENRIATLVALIAEGYTAQVHLGHDAACFYDFMVGNPWFAEEKPDYLHISQNVVPALRAAGVTAEQVDDMLVGNPRRFFA